MREIIAIQKIRDGFDFYFKLLETADGAVWKLKLEGIK